MYLKKKSIQMPFSDKMSFNICYADESDLKNGVPKLCDCLQKGSFVVQIFSADSLNETLKASNAEFLKYKNFNYYLRDNLDFLCNIAFENLRFLNIYGTEEKIELTDVKVKEIEKDYAFQLGFDNYLEFVEIKINRNSYDKQIIDNITSGEIFQTE